MADALPGLLKLPNELLRKIAAPLSPVDLRRLSQVSHRLLYFIFDYSRPYVTGLAALPNELLLEVVAHLGDRDRSQLARTSHRFYPLVTDTILREEVRSRGIKLLRFALKKRRVGLLRRLLQRGADVETRLNIFTKHVTNSSGTLLSHATYHDDLGMVKMLLQFGANVHAQSDYRLHGVVMSPTPLHLAVYYGHGHLAKVLLQSGASQTVGGKLELLSIAIFRRHEHIVRRFLRALDSADGLSMSALGQLIKTASEGQLRSFSLDIVRQYDKVVLRHLKALWPTNKPSEATVAMFMKGAVTGKLVVVTEYLAQLRGQLGMEQTDYMDSALYCIVSIDAYKGDICKRELHQEVYQIVDTLLKYGADPDAPAEGRSLTKTKTARDMASMHPDPRVRNRLSKVVHLSRPDKKLPLRTGRSWTSASQASLVLTSESSELGAKSSASLWDFLDPYERHDQAEGHVDDVPNVPENDYDGVDGDQALSTTASLSTSADYVSEEQTKPQSTPPPDLHSFPRLASSTEGSTPAENRVWADAPSKIRSAPITSARKKDSLHTRKLLATVQTKRSQADQFPALVTQNQKRLADIKIGVWAAAVPKSQADVERTEIDGTHTSDAGTEMSKQEGSGKVAKRKKKNKKNWEKLVLS